MPIYALMYTPNKEHMRKGKTSSAAAKTLRDTYGNDVVNENTCRRWFSAGGFKRDDSSLKDERQIESRTLKKLLNSEQLHVAIEENPTCTTRELSKTF
ncbi:hypothetical protein ACTXT7_008127 [Hymenolepis weldensis]